MKIVYVEGKSHNIGSNMSRKVSHRRKPKAIPKQERLRDVNLFPKRE